MELDRSPTRGRKLGLAQVALAAVVAGSMLMFSALAFRTGILDGRSGGVRPSTRSAHGGGPVVLPAATAEPEVAGRRVPRAPDRILVAELERGTDAVLGTRIAVTDDAEPQSDRTGDKGAARDGHKRGGHKGKGHDKAKGKGHHKGNGKGHHENDRDRRSPDEAKEDDDDWDGHGPDDDHDDDDDGSESSRSRSGHRSRGRSGGSGSNSGRDRA